MSKHLILTMVVIFLASFLCSCYTVSGDDTNVTVTSETSKPSTFSETIKVSSTLPSINSSTQTKALVTTKASVKESGKKTGSSKSASSATTVHNESARIYPITHVPSKLSGMEIPFTVGVNKDIQASDDSVWFDVKIAKSFSQLEAIYNSDENPNRNNYIEKYSETFFRDNAVIVMFITRSSGSINHRIDTLTKNGGELCIGISTTALNQGNEGSTDIAFWRTLLEVKKEDITDIVKISCFNKE